MRSSLPLTTPRPWYVATNTLQQAKRLETPPITPYWGRMWSMSLGTIEVPHNHHRYASPYFLVHDVEVRAIGCL